MPPSATTVPTPVGVKNAPIPLAPGAQSFGEGALRGQFDEEFTGQELSAEFLVLTDVGGDDAGDAVIVEQQSQAGAVYAAVVGHDGEVVAPPPGRRRSRIQGMPDKPNPPTPTEAPSTTSATASAALATTLFTTELLTRVGISLQSGPRTRRSGGGDATVNGKV